MENTIAFTVKGSDNLFFLSVGRTLINFIEFDLGPFYRECEALAEESARSRSYDESYEVLPKERLKACHPYFAACYGGAFDRIVLDCVIDILSRSSGLGLEAMWARNISAEDTLGREIFARISDYKTGHAVNQWANLQRMQKYAQKKAQYVFGQPADDPAEYDMRAMYFDLSFSTAARLSGLGDERAPAIRCAPTGLLGAAPEMFSSVSAMAASMLGAMPQLGASASPHGVSDCVRELNDGVVCAELSRLPPPDKLEMISVRKKLGGLPRRTYVPESLKAAIDLEFDELLEKKLCLEPVGATGRFELRAMYRPAPTPVFTLRPTEESELYEAAPESESAPESGRESESDSAPEQTATDDNEELAELRPEKLYAALEPEDEPEATDETVPEQENKAESETETEQAGEAESETAPDTEQETAPDAETAESIHEPRIVPVTGQRARAGRRPKKSSVPDGQEPEPEAEPASEESEPEREVVILTEDDETAGARRETEEQNRASAASKMEVKRIAAPVAEIAMLTDDSYGRKPRRDRRSAPMDVPGTAEERMQLLQRLAADKRRSVRRHEGQDVDIFCQSVHTALSAAMKDSQSKTEEEKWAKLLFRIRGGVMTRRYSTEYLYRFLDATVEMYRLDI